MCTHRSKLFGTAILLCLSACASPNAKLTYRLVTSGQAVTADGAAFNFVLPRTVIKVSVANGQTTAPVAAAPATGAVKDSAKGALQLSLVAVPVAYDEGNKLLQVFSVTDDSGGLFSLTPTTLTGVSYADRYIISSIGTQVTDNRSQVLDMVFSLAGLAGKVAGLGFAAAGPQETCDPQVLPPPFVIDAFDQSVSVTKKGFVPGTKCWGYEVQVIHAEDGPDMYQFFKDDGTLALPLNESVPWFPYPACRSVKISVYACTPNSVNECDPLNSGPKNLVGVTNVSLGKHYRRITLPVKGKIAFHPDFCVADVTNDSSGVTTGWTLLQKAITDYQGLSQAGQTTPAPAKPATTAAPIHH